MSIYFKRLMEDLDVPVCNRADSELCRSIAAGQVCLSGPEVSCVYRYTLLEAICGEKVGEEQTQLFNGARAPPF